MKSISALVSVIALVFAQLVHSKHAPEPGIHLDVTALDNDTTLTPGLYSFFQGASISATTTLSGPGNFTFIIPSQFVTVTGSAVVLADGATPELVFWDVGAEAVLGSGSVFVGNINAGKTITVEADVSVTGTLTADQGVINES